MSNHDPEEMPAVPATSIAYLMARMFVSACVETTPVVELTFGVVFVEHHQLRILLLPRLDGLPRASIAMSGFCGVMTTNVLEGGARRVRPIPMNDEEGALKAVILKIFDQLGGVRSRRRRWSHPTRKQSRRREGRLLRKLE
ncbi:hypothetical protein ACIQUB_30715 [Rhizobium sp. NPDC090275]|uniref:hypothetical protein n=1 Tax=Rhizobium sp. NPDC090275 TaxID=3364498 RepID=UPI00383AE024